MGRGASRDKVVRECRQSMVADGIHSWAIAVSHGLGRLGYASKTSAFVAMATKQRRIAEQRPATIAAKIVANATMLECTVADILGLLDRAPTLLNKSPEALRSSLSTIGTLLDHDDALSLARRYPSMLAADPLTLANAIKDGAHALGISEAQFKAAARRQPQILVMDQAQQASRIAKTAEALGLPFQSYMQAVLKQPQLAYQSPETIIVKVQRSSNALDVSVADFIQAAMTLPTLLYTDPDTIAGKRPLLDALARACETTLRDLIVLAPTALARSSRALEARLAVAAAFPGRFKANTLISMTEAQIAALGGTC